MGMIKNFSIGFLFKKMLYSSTPLILGEKTEDLAAPYSLTVILISNVFLLPQVTNYLFYVTHNFF